MILSQRERYLAIGAAGLLGLVLIQVMVISPYLSRRDAIATELTSTRGDVDHLEMLYSQQQRLKKVWNEMNAGGLSNSPSDAESLLQQALDEWAQECDVNVSQLKYERTNQEGKFLQISFHLTGAGPLSTMSRLLWRLETTPMPLRITEVQITPRKEGLDDLQLQLDVSTLCRIPDAEKVEGTRGGSATADLRGDRL